jgi:flagellar hook-associated protein 1 FlgK
MSNALSALKTNSTALDVVSSNISNINTPGYAKRVVNEAAQAPGGQLSGVEIADIQRVVDQYLSQQTLSATASSSSYSAQNDVLSQINALLGQVGDGTDVVSQLDNVFSALGSASLSPTASTTQQAVLTALNKFASSVSSLSSSLKGVQTQVDQQVVTDVSSANGFIQQIQQLNQEIATQVASGNTYTSLLDQRDQLVQNLSGLIGVTTQAGPNGQLMVSTTDGVALVGTSTYATLSYSGGNSNGTYNPIVLQSVSALTGQPVGPSQALNPDISSGKIAGLLQMRDGTVSSLQQELGSFAKQTALAFNAQYNANASFPPPTSLTGRNTGLLSTDALNFTGDTTLAVTDPNGNLVSRIDVDFGAGTLSVDGGAAVGIGGTVGSFVSALNTALGSNGSASFANGVLSVDAAGSNGITVQDDASNPTSRGGAGFSQFFGLNDLFQSAVPTITATGLSASDASGFAAGGTMQLALQGPKGAMGPQASVTLTAGMTIGDIVTALNSAFGSAANFTLSSNGQLTMTPGTGYPGYSLDVQSDSTQRGTTGMSVSSLFGLGTEETVDQAESFAVNPSVASGQNALSFATPQITPTTVAGGTVVASGDSSGLLALQNLSNTQISFPAAGILNAQTNTLGNYAGSFYQSIATITQSTQSNATASSDQLTEAQSRQSQESGVNLDAELSNMVLYQQAYSAGARVMQSVEQVFATLMQIQ